MTKSLQRNYCLAVRHDMATTVFFVRAADDLEAVSEAHRIVERFVGDTDVPVELRRADDPTEWRSASRFLTDLRRAGDSSGAVVPI